MSKLVTTVGVLAVLWAGPVQAQSLQERAQNIIDGMGDASATFNNGTMVDTVTPFETATPDEVDLNQADFDAQEVLIEQSDTMTGRAFSSQRDSFNYRPDIDLGDDPLALADDAVEQSEAVAGGLFSSGGGECSASFEGGEFSGQKFCRRILSRDTRQCYDTRQITVDRRDVWSCGIEGAKYGKKCTKTVNYQCTGVTGGTCRKRLITFPSRTSSWSSDGRLANVTIPDNDKSSCQVKTDTFRIRRNDKVQLTQFRLNRLQFNGAAMVLIDGEHIITYNPYGSVVPEPPSSPYFSTDHVGLDVHNGVVWINNYVPGSILNGFMGLCSDTRRTKNLNINLMDYLPNRALARAVVSGNQLQRPGGSQSDDIVVKIIRANTREADPNIRFEFNGACCSSLSVTDGGSC
jgi:hypothetical protein